LLKQYQTAKEEDMTTTPKSTDKSRFMGVLDLYGNRVSLNFRKKLMSFLLNHFMT
jgi:Na+/H+ antiporter NhaA